MKVKSDYVLRSVAGSYFIIPVGEESVNSSRMITVNESGKAIWDALQTDRDFDGVMKIMLETYDVSEEQMKQDLEAFLATLRNAGILEE